MSSCRAKGNKRDKRSVIRERREGGGGRSSLSLIGCASCMPSLSLCRSSRQRLVRSWPSLQVAAEAQPRLHQLELEQQTVRQSSKEEASEMEALLPRLQAQEEELRVSKLQRRAEVQLGQALRDNDSEFVKQWAQRILTMDLFMGPFMMNQVPPRNSRPASQLQSQLSNRSRTLRRDISWRVEAKKLPLPSPSSFPCIQMAFPTDTQPWKCLDEAPERVGQTIPERHLYLEIVVLVSSQGNSPPLEHNIVVPMWNGMSDTIGKSTKDLVDNLPKMDPFLRPRPVLYRTWCAPPHHLSPRTADALEWIEGRTSPVPMEIASTHRMPCTTG